MLIRQLEYLTALAREQHFGRAADECGVTQPTLSAGIKQLEREFDVPLVRRGTRFEGFTPEGERVLRRAYLILAERDALSADVGLIREGLTGRLRIGAIPTALTTLALLVSPFADAHPRVNLSVESMSSADIVARLGEFALDIGITYIDNDPLPSRVTVTPLYRERYVLLTRELALTSRRSVSWAEAARFPLGLLTPDMQNRRILNDLFGQAGVSPAPILETNSVSTLYAQVLQGHLSSVVPHAWLHLFGLPVGMYALPMVRPRATKQIGIIALDREPRSVLGRAMVEVVGELDLQSMLDHVLKR